MHRIAKAFAVLATVGISTTSMATPFTDEAAWRAAVSNVFAFEDFDGIADGSDVGQLAALGIQFDPLDDATQPTVQSYANTGGLVRSGPHNLLNDRDFSLPARGPYNIRTIDPTDLLFGIGLWNVGGDDRLRMTFFDATDTVIEQVVSDLGIGFFGLVNAGGASRVQIDFVDGNAYSPVDDLQTAVRKTFIPNAVPEPSSLAMLGLTAGGFAMFRRRSAKSRRGVIAG